MRETILLVEDDPALLDALGLAVGLDDYNVQLADSVAAAQGILARARVDLIIADTMEERWDPMLPAIQQIQAAAPSTPLVLYSGYPVTEQIDPAAANLAAVWIKPLDLNSLLSAIRGVLDLAARGGLPDRRSPGRAPRGLPRSLEP